MKLNKNLTTLCLLISVLFINACSGLTQSDHPATKTWWLKPYTGMAQVAPSDQLALPVVTVTAVPGLDTDRILTLSDTAELNHFAASRWADNMPELVSSLVSRSLELSGQYGVVSEPGSRRCDLQLELREFFARLSSSGQTTEVRIAIHGHYQCGTSAAESIHLDASVPIRENRMSVIVDAFQQAMDSAIKQMLGQL